MTTSSLNTYTYKYIQFSLLKLSMGDKKYNVVIINPRNYKENMKLHIHIPCTFTFMIHICTQIYINIGQERVFMMKSFLFNIQNKSFHDRVISLV